MFLRPVYQLHRINPRLQRIAKRTLVAATVALITSVINVAILTIVHGQELGWICLISCGWDVAINAICLFFVTSSLDDTDPTPIPVLAAEAARRRPDIDQVVMERSRISKEGDTPGAEKSARDITDSIDIYSLDLGDRILHSEIVSGPVKSMGTCQSLPLLQRC